MLAALLAAAPLNAAANKWTATSNIKPTNGTTEETGQYRPLGTQSHSVTQTRRHACIYHHLLQERIAVHRTTARHQVEPWSFPVTLAIYQSLTYLLIVDKPRDVRASFHSNSVGFMMSVLVKGLMYLDIKLP